MKNPISLALVILEDAQGRIVLQLRDHIPGIANPGHWGLFGGHVEKGEQPVQAAVREIQEELTCVLHPEKMKFLFNLDRPTGKYYFVFIYQINDELREARLTEGKRFGYFSPSQIELGEIEGAKIVTHHLGVLTDYWSGVSPLHKLES